jgi:prepilin-type N-terminal cleavage/methylation domain-containing protein
MNVQQKQKQKGFTIIEVVLVLAIAGLIFLMVFIALPALQRSQRDAQRKTDMSRAITAVTNFAGNNRNRVPQSSSDWNKLVTGYLKTSGDTFADPTGEDYEFKNISKTAPEVPGTFDSTQPYIYVTLSAVCNGESVTTNQGNNKVALQMKLEGGGIACDNN